MLLFLFTLERYGVKSFRFRWVGSGVHSWNRSQGFTRSFNNHKPGNHQKSNLPNATIFFVQQFKTDVSLSIPQLMICTGVSVSFIIGTLLTWRALALVGKSILKHIIAIFVRKRTSIKEIPLVHCCRHSPLCRSAFRPCCHSRVPEMACKDLDTWSDHMSRILLRFESLLI